MKKMGFTKSRWHFSFMRYLGACLVLLSLCLGSGSLNAQNIVMKYAKGDTTKTPVKLTECGGTVDSKDRRFTDDGTNDSNYADPTGHLRRDTVEICPKDKWHRVKVVFTDFDLEMGDTLYAKDGDIAAVRAGTAPAIGSGSGVGVAQAYGGWAAASCSPSLNPSGCITFLFATDGDNRKGSGWDAWVDCEEKDFKFATTTIADAKLKCNETSVSRTIFPPFVIACGDTLKGSQDSVRMLIKNQHGVTCVDTCIARNSAINSYTGDFAIGQYSVEHILKDDTKKTAKQYFSVQAPSLVCNDEINVPLGAACMVQLGPDDVLESTCDTSRYIQYNITLTLPGAHGFKDVVKKTTGHDNLSAQVQYPIITREDIAKAGLKACDVKAKVRIERIYFGDRDGDGKPDLPTGIECNNGTKKLYCETEANLFDDEKPWIDAIVPDTMIACDTLGLHAMLTYKASDNCDSDVPVTYTVAFDETDPCFSQKGSTDTTKVTVNFTAVDDCGNVGTSSKSITFIRPDLDSLKFVAKTGKVSVECNKDATIPTPGIKIGLWKNNQFIVKDTIPLSTEKYICGYILTSEDEDIPSTDCGKKKYRYWSVLDWCEKDGPKAIDTTFIETTDKTAPVFADTKDGLALCGKKYNAVPSVALELSHFDCTYDIYKLNKPKATDNCDLNPQVSISNIYRVENCTLWEITDKSQWTKLDCDSFLIKWVVEDDCHEQLKTDITYQLVEIKDVTRPSAACVDQLNVSLPNEWGARVCVDDIDAGSYDACGIKKMEIRIKGKYTDPNAGWTECIDIGCEYVHPDLQIEMRVTDKKGNENVCWLDVVVEDKIVPYCEPLKDYTDDCDKYHNGDFGPTTDANEDFAMSDSEYLPLTGNLMDFYNTRFGNPKTLKACQDNLNAAECGDLEYEQEYQVIAWPCGEVKAKRRYRAIDWTGNKSAWAVQSITIKYKANWKITFPADWEGSCGDMAPAEAIVISNGPCDLLGYEVTEKQYEIPGDACFKIERTYHVINWCKYVAGQEPVELSRVEGEHGFANGLMVTSEGNDDKGYWTYIQVLKVHDDEAPVVTITNPDPCINGVEFDALPYGEEDVTPGAAPYECDELKTWTATATDCSNNISWVGKLYNANTGELVKQEESNEITYVVSNKDSYYAEFWAYDNCGNSGGAKGDPTKFWDCKKPTPYVLNGVAVELMPAGMVQVWATDLNQNSFDNCTDQSKLDFRIYADFLGDAPQDLAGVQSLGKVITFDCDRVGTNVVYIYVIDEEGNWDFAQTYVIVQDNMNACTTVEPGDGGMVAGTIVNPQGENVESVNIAITGGATESMTTGADGHFMFMLDKGQDYTVTPAKDINPLNGVSTFDLVLISKHILGITTFDSPYKYIAADVNKSGSITAFDMVQLRQLILNITNEFPSNDSWRFVDATHQFTSTNPASEDFAEFYTINALNANMENLDFVGVKVGDVNGNAQANSLLGAESRTVNGTFTLNAADRFVEAGEVVTVEFTAADIASTQGYQFTLNLAGQNASVVEGVAKAANFNTNMADRGVIATSWNGEASANDVLFAVTFNATTSGLLSDMVSVSSDVTTAEAYNAAGELQGVNIEFTSAVANGFELNQNTPNPFSGETVIGFNLPQAGTATLTVMDVQGKVLKAIKADYAKGYNQVTLKANELNATGVLYYQLESADNVATKKMIIIE